MRIEAEGIFDHIQKLVGADGRVDQDGDEILGFVPDVSGALREALRGQDINAVVVQNSDDVIKMIETYKATPRGDGFYDVMVKKGPTWRKF